MSTLRKPVIYLQGGLGNQLFQYAFYKQQKVDDLKAVVDIGRVIYDQQHNNISIVTFLQLSKNEYQITDNQFLPLLVKDSFLAKCIRYIYRALNVRKLRLSFYDFDAMSSFNCISRNKINYIGYFQFVESALSAKSYFESKLSELYQNQLNSYSLSYAGKVGLHIRRGDFILSQDPKHDCVSLDYVKTAINNTMKDIVVFSDDINWCKDNLSEYCSLEFHCGKSAFDDFLALSQCSNYILSGSTFSWWAAFLFSSSKTEITFPKEQQAQFLSKDSNDKIGWRYSAL
jgi:hypothetical protein